MFKEMQVKDYLLKFRFELIWLLDMFIFFPHKLLILNPFHYFCNPKIEANGTFEIGSYLTYQTNESKNQN
jgi:hypothetical protein